VTNWTDRQNGNQSVKPINKHESEIVWLRSPAGLPYLREGVYLARYTKRGQWPPRQEQDAVIYAYEVMEPLTRIPGSYYNRRYWKFRTDRDPYPSRPVEAVDPKSIQAGKESVRASRA